MTAPLDTPLPCPFCGEPPRVVRQALLNAGMHWIGCCCNSTDDPSAVATGVTRAEALAKWNRRAPQRDVTP